MDNLKQTLEAILFVSDEPLTLSRLHALVPDAKPSEIQEAIVLLRQEYEQTGRAFTVEEIADGFQMLTRPQYGDIITTIKKAKAEKKLSAAALEALAIIAYRQPIKRVDIEAVRGVQSGEVIRALMERGLVKIAGRDAIPGSPLMYSTSKEFLETFGLKSIEDLPRPEEVK